MSGTVDVDTLLTEARVARRVGLYGSRSFKDFWSAARDASDAGSPLSLGGSPLVLVPVEASPGKVSWRMRTSDLPRVLEAIGPLCGPKTDEWLSGADLRRHVPGDCETVAKRTWEKLQDMCAEASQVTVGGQPLVVERRRAASGTVPCLSRDSLPLFMKAVKIARNRQIEASVAHLVDDDARERVHGM